MANLKLWQSLGIGVMFGIAQLNSLRLSAALLLGSLVLSSAALLCMHICVADLDSGQRRAHASHVAALRRVPQDPRNVATPQHRQHRQHRQRYQRYQRAASYRIN